LTNRQALNGSEMEEIFSAMIAGELEPVHIAALLVGLRTKGETPEEIAGAAKALRDHALPFPAPSGTFVDVCGTGGDSSGTINISTAAAMVLAEMGIPVAKHGNRSVSSKCGSADLLEAFGVKLDPEPATARKCLDEVGICFLFAPQYHSGMRHAMPVRKALKMRTIFNILGPLANPAQPPVQLMGVYDPALVAPLAKTLSHLGARRSLVVHGDGLDEISVSAPTTAAMSTNGTVESLELTPEQAGLKRYPLGELAGGGAEENRKLIEALLSGKGSPAHQAAVAINAGAAAWVAGAAPSLRDGTQAALETIRSGKCIERISKWAEISHGS
jgi:anthranilate phosphoribosyltransferase